MSVTIVFLGKLADLAPAAQIRVPGPLDWAGLLAMLPEELARAAAAPTTRIALNGEVLADNTTLMAQEGAEVALLPPVSGG